MLLEGEGVNGNERRLPPWVNGAERCVVKKETANVLTPSLIKPRAAEERGEAGGRRSRPAHGFPRDQRDAEVSK